jgi:hypothetical protein
MYKIVTYISLFLLYIPSFTQSIQNVRFNQEGEKIVIHYDLAGKSGSRDLFTVSIYYTLDNGISYTPLRSVFGDVGSNVSPGSNKKVMWNVLNDVNELTGEVKFKVVANPEMKASTFWDYDVFLSIRTLGDMWPFGGRIGILGPKRAGFYASFLYGINYESWEEKYIFLIGPIINIVNKEKFRLSGFTGFGIYYYDEFDEYYDYYYGSYDYAWIDHRGYYVEGGMIFTFKHFNITIGIESTDFLMPFAGIGFTL